MLVAMDIDNEVKQILDSLFTSVAKKSQVAKRETALLFQLKSRAEFKCSYNGNLVSVGEAGIKAQLFAGKINKVITTGLIRLANENGIDLSQVNLIMTTNQQHVFVIILRNGNKAVKQIELNEFLNF